MDTTRYLDLTGIAMPGTLDSEQYITARRNGYLTEIAWLGNGWLKLPKHIAQASVFFGYNDVERVWKGLLGYSRRYDASPPEARIILARHHRLHDFGVPIVLKGQWPE